jgi:hypothetical protein
MRELTRQAWLGLAKLVAILVLCLFLPAWSFDFWEAWTYVGVFGASVAAITWHLQKQDAELLQRRPAAETERRQKVIQAIASIAFAGIFPDGFVRDRDAAMREEVFDVAEAQGEAVVEPNGVAGNGGREWVARIADDVVGHPATLPTVPSS